MEMPNDIYLFPVRGGRRYEDLQAERGLGCESKSYYNFRAGAIL